MRHSLMHAQVAIAALRERKVADALSEIAQSQAAFSAFVGRQVGGQQPLVSLASPASAEALEKAMLKASAELKLFISAVRWNELDLATGYLANLGL